MLSLKLRVCVCYFPVAEGDLEWTKHFAFQIQWIPQRGLLPRGRFSDSVGI